MAHSQMLSTFPDKTNGHTMYVGLCLGEKSFDFLNSLLCTFKHKNIFISSYYVLTHLYFTSFLCMCLHHLHSSVFPSETGRNAKYFSGKLAGNGEQLRVDNKSVVSAVEDFSLLPSPISVPCNQENILHYKMLCVLVLQKGV